jgi:hypothetical protein
MNIQVQEASKTPNRLHKIELPQDMLSLKQQAQKIQRTLKVVREKKQITYKGKPIKIIAGFSMEILKARRAWSEVFLTLNEKKINSRILPKQNYN